MRNVELNMQQNHEHRSTAFSIFQAKGLVKLKTIEHSRKKMYYDM